MALCKSGGGQNEWFFHSFTFEALKDFRYRNKKSSQVYK